MKYLVLMTVIAVAGAVATPAGAAKKSTLGYETKVRASLSDAELNKRRCRKLLYKLPKGIGGNIRRFGKAEAMGCFRQ